MDTTEVTTIEPAARAMQATPPTGNSSDALMRIIEAAMNREGFDLDKVERLLNIKEQWEKREAEKAYNVAFAAFKAEAVEIIKNKTVTDGPLRGKSYAELFVVVDAVTPALSKHGLSSSWKLTKDEPGWLEVTCTLRHVLGHSDSVSMGGPPDTGGAKNAIQARASSISYLERYTLKAICGLSERGEDDDGAGAKKGTKSPRAEGRITPTDGAGDGLDDDARLRMEQVASMIVAKWTSLDESDQALDIWYADDTCDGSDERVYLWSLLKRYSALRTAINNDPRSGKSQRKAA